MIDSRPFLLHNQTLFVSFRKSITNFTAEDLVNEGVLHPHMRQRIPGEIDRVLGHREVVFFALWITPFSGG